MSESWQLVRAKRSWVPEWAWWLLAKSGMVFAWPLLQIFTVEPKEEAAT